LNQSEGHLKLLERVNAMEKQHEQLLTRNNVLQRVNDQLLKEKLTMNKIMILEKEAEENVTRSLTNHEEVFQEFLSSSIGRTRLASMIYVISMNHGEGIGSSEAPRKKKTLEDQKSASNVYTKE
jgi:hypothetical protein